MIKSNKIGKSVSLLLGRAGVGFLFLAFTACSTVQNVPIDDAYYSPAVEKPAIIATPSSSTGSTSASIDSSVPNTSTPSTSVEYINVQDTTVTVRIKK